MKLYLSFFTSIFLCVCIYSSLEELPRFKSIKKQTVYKSHYKWMTPDLYKIIDNTSKKHNISKDEICAIIHSESYGNPYAKSKSNARGLMQIIGKYHYKGNPNDLYNPKLNIDLGVRFYKYCKQKSNGNIALALIYYNAGPNFNVKKYPKKLYQHYVKVIIKNCIYTKTKSKSFIITI